MSWIENIKKDFTITTGDGVRFRPNWLNARRAMDFNIAVFNFKGVKGSLVNRNEPMGRVYDIEIYFQGDDNLIKATDFLDSSENKKAWQISHPMYGQLFVQPISGLDLDDTSYNVTKLTFKVMETIGAKLVKTNINPIDAIQAKKLSTDAAFAQSYVNEVPIPDISDIQAMRANVSIADRLLLAFATLDEEAQAITNTYNSVNTAIDNAASEAFTAISGIQSFLSLPVNFQNTIFNRLKFLVQLSQNLYASVDNITIPDLKKLYENNVATLLSTMCAASVTNITASDYPNRGNVLQVISLITESYNSYIANLDSLQTANGGNIDSYIPDFDSQYEMAALVRFTISNLFDIAANAKQQRIKTLADDTNLILVAFELYGLLNDDSTIEQLINDNNISSTEYLLLKKGRKIIYYV